MNRLTERIVRRILLALGTGVAVALSVAVAPGSVETARAQAPTAVSIVDFAFQPATVTVPVGGTVTWTNRGNAPHTSTSRTGVWDSGIMTTGQSFSFTFRQAGSFAYFCAVHPQRMMGTVVVQGAAAAQPAPAAQATPRPAAAAPAPAAQRPAGTIAAPKAQRAAAAPAAVRPAAAPQVQRAAAAPAARPAAQAPAAMPRTGTGGPLAADNESVAPAVAATAVLLLGLLALAYRRRRV